MIPYGDGPSGEIRVHFLPRREENRCVAAVETGGKQGSPGALHLDGSNLPIRGTKHKREA